MHTYDVQLGDSPAQIAVKFAGCPKCAIDLVRANPHKPTVTFPNGFTTFRQLAVGEKLSLPNKWFDGDLEMRPPAYFAALPYADGTTSSTLGDAASGVLGDYASLDAATARVGALASMDDQSFSNAVGDTGALIDSAVQEAYGSSNPTASARAQDVQNGTKWAWQRNADLATALAAGNQTAVTQARLDIQNALSTAIGNARLALQAFYGAPAAQPPAPAPAGATFPATVMTAAQAAAAAIAADASYCTSVARAGTAVNSAVHNFKAAWNASQSPAVPINTGNYEQPTADAMARVIGTAPAACGAHVAPPPPPPVAPVAQTCPAGSAYDASSRRCVALQRAPVVQAPAPQTGLSTGAVVGIGLAGAAVVGGAAYLASRPPTRGRRRRTRR